MITPILRTILMNPRWTLGLTAVAATAALGLAATTYVASQRVASLESQLDAAHAQLQTQKALAEGIAALADARKADADRAVAVAFEAGRADRRAAQVYLDLPVPPPAERCDAAQALIDQAIREN